MPQKKIRPRVKHYIIEVFGLNPNILLHTKSIKKFIDKFINTLNLKILDKLVYDFKPFGATYLFVLSGSHLAVHTWPENNYLHIDLFVCSTVKPKKNLKKVIKNIFKTNNFKIRQVFY